MPLDCRAMAHRGEPCPYNCGGVVGHPDSPSCDRPTPRTEAGRRLLGLAGPDYQWPESLAADILAIEREAALPEPLDVDVLANIIRQEDGNHSLGAGALAERIVARLRGTGGAPE